MNPMHSRQTGMTLISFLVIFIVAGFLILLTLKTVPVYLDHMKITSSLEGLKTESRLVDKSPQEVKRMLQRRWDINSVEGITAEDSVFIEKKNGVMSIEVAYEVERQVMGNMSLLMKFDDTITVGEPN